MHQYAKPRSLLFLLILTIVLGGCSGGYNPYDDTPAEERAEEERDYIYGLRAALEEANSNIEEANAAIEDARSYVGASYGEMAEALEGLSTIETVPEP